MIYKILTVGWLIRIFVVLLMLVALLARCFSPMDKVSVVPAVILFANGFLYFAIAARLALLSHSTMSALLPNYFTQVKRALLVLFGVSLIPTLMLLPDIISWLSTVSILITMAVYFVAITYQPKLSFGLLFVIVFPYLSDLISQQFAELDGLLALAWASPILACLGYWLLSKLETYKGNPKHIKKLITLTNSNINRDVISVDAVPLKSQNKLTAWIANTNFNNYRTLIRSSKEMTNNQLIATTCQASSIMGYANYLLLCVGVSGLLLLEKYVSQEDNALVNLLMIGLPVMLIGGGSINLFQTINNKQRLLQRLSIMPCFNGNFSTAFIAFVMKVQAKNYAFTLLSIAAWVYVSDYLTLSMFANVLLISVALLLFQFTLMFWSWSSRLQLQGFIVWMIILSFIFSMVTALIVIDRSVVLTQSMVFITSLLVAALLFVVSVYRSYRVGLKLP